MHLSAPVIAICCLATAFAGERETKGVDITLLAEKPAIAPGETLTVGLKIHHHPKFHTYWQSPGIAGVPTSLKWELPPGFTAGPILWPVPEQSMMATHPVHGYERDVLLLVNITAPAELQGGKVELKATSGWMACADGCYPGPKDLTLSLATAATPLPVEEGAKALFESARAELPKPLQGWMATVASGPEDAQIRLILTPATRITAVPEGLYFFSSDGQVSSDKVQTVTLQPDGAVEMRFTRSEYGPREVSTLPGVLKAASPLTVDGPAFGSIAPTYPGKEGAAAGAAVPASAVAPTPECCCEKP